MEQHFQAVVSILTGVALASACGFRVFVPLLVASLAVRGGVVHVADDFTWIGSLPAILCFSVATLLELGGYFLPLIDHFLDVVATPAAIVAGTLLTAGFITDMDPWFRWSLAAVAGGGVAAGVQAATVVTRAASRVLTLGLANPLVAGAEFAGSAVISTLAAIAPLLALLVAIVLVAWLWSLRKRRAAAAVESRTASWGSPS